MKKFSNYIGGQWCASEDYRENQNPSDLQDSIGLFAQASESQARLAIEAATQAQRQWAQYGLEKRYEILMAIGQELKARAPELGEMLAREEGKTLPEGKGEVFRAGQFFTYYAAEVLRQIGDNADSVREGISIDVRREPLGVVAVISPWNFPIATAAWKIAPALAFGNAVVWKPASLTPFSAWALAEIFSRQDIPDGLLNLVMASGASIGRLIAESPSVQGISFTGSVETGREIASLAIKNMTKIQMEMGAKNPIVIDNDADCSIAVSAAVQGAFGSTGQKCTASSRIIVLDKIYDEFVGKMIEATKALRVGHALDETTQIGPVASKQQLASNIEYLQLARKEGCEQACGGEQPTQKTEGYYLTPALFLNSENSMRVNNEEMFAPIACVIKVHSYDEALAVANDSKFGLVAAIITKSLARANHFQRNSNSGCVMVNLPTAGTDYHVPFGGRGHSSYGTREQGQYAVEFYSQVKTCYINSGSSQD